MIRLYDEDENEIKLPRKWEICSACDGHGRSSAYLGAFTGDQMAEDPEFAEDYFTGAYDRSCDVCGGSGKVQVVDYARLSPELRAKYDEAARDEAEYRQMCEMERRMGA